MSEKVRLLKVISKGYYAENDVIDDYMGKENTHTVEIKPSIAFNYALPEVLLLLYIKGLKAFKKVDEIYFASYPLAKRAAKYYGIHSMAKAFIECKNRGYFLINVAQNGGEIILGNVDASDGISYSPTYEMREFKRYKGIKTRL